MAATHHLSPGQWRQPQPEGEQLPMFMSAGEVRRYYPSVDSDLNWNDTGYDHDEMPREVNDEMMSDKLDEATWHHADGGSLYDSIERRGVERPVQILRGSSTIGDHPSWAKGMLGNGGHRVAVADHIDPDMLIPVTHHNVFVGEARYEDDFASWDAARVRRQHAGTDEWDGQGW